MGHAFQTSDEQYAKLAAYAAERGQTPETLFQEWVSMITRDTEKLPSVSGGKPTDHEQQAEREEALLNSPLFQAPRIFPTADHPRPNRPNNHLPATHLHNN